MNKKHLLGSILLLMAAFIWGITFISTRYINSQGFGVFFEILVRYMTPFTLFGILYHKKIRKTSLKTIFKCISAGLILFTTIVCSIYGIRMVKHGSMGLLLLSLYVIFVPIVSILMNKKKIPAMLLLASFLSLIGTLLLCSEAPEGAQNIGSLLCFCASIGYTAYIIVCSQMLNIDTPPPILQFYQSLTFLTLSLPLFMIIDMPTFPSIDVLNLKLIGALIFVGICSGTIGYQLYFYGQKFSSPTTTAIILASQSVFGALADLIVFKINLKTPSIIAYVIIMSATFIAACHSVQKN